MFGRYQVLRKLGEGGMGLVYEAEHVDLGKRVALKTLRGDLASNAAIVARFVREGQAAARIRHPHVVDVTDVGTAEGVPYLVMEMLDGETLAARIARGPIGADEVTALLLPVCAAVATAHAMGVLHRDLKPDNIFLGRAAHGRVHPTVLDFGIAKIVDEDVSLSLTNTATVLGTPFYMSPEQARGARDLDARSDQYALGVIAYECGTGRRPFEGASLLALASAITTGALRPPRALVPALPEAFEAVVLRAMARDPARRFPSVWELGAALLPFADAQTHMLWEGTFHPPGGLPPVLERRRTPPALARAAPALALAETEGKPRPVVADRLALQQAPSRRARPWWAVAAAGGVLLGLASYRLTRTPPSAPAASPVVDAGTVASPAAPTVVVTDADVAVADVVTARATRARPAPAPARGGPARPPARPPGQREIPME